MPFLLRCTGAGAALHEQVEVEVEGGMGPEGALRAEVVALRGDEATLLPLGDTRAAVPGARSCRQCHAVTAHTAAEGGDGSGAASSAWSRRRRRGTRTRRMGRPATTRSQNEPGHQQAAQHREA